MEVTGASTDWWEFSLYLLLHYGLIGKPLCLGGKLLLQRLLLRWPLLHLCPLLLQSSPCTGTTGLGPCLTPSCVAWASSPQICDLLYGWP